jgi:hypothetical protein
VALNGYTYCDSSIYIFFPNDDSHMFINTVMVQEWVSAWCEEDPHIFICRAVILDLICI